jgi:hypothetical protein
MSAKYEPFDMPEIKSYTEHRKLKEYIYPRNQYVVSNVEIGNDKIIFEDNPLVSTPDVDVESELLNRLKGIWYKPSMIQVVGRPWVELGDSYLFTTRKNIIRSYVLKRTLKGIQALFDTYEAEGEMPNEKNAQNNGQELDARAVNIGVNDSDTGNLTVNGHIVTFKDITISGTTYHLLGYTD